MELFGFLAFHCSNVVFKNDGGGGQGESRLPGIRLSSHHNPNAKLPTLFVLAPYAFVLHSSFPELSVTREQDPNHSQITRPLSWPCRGWHGASGGCGAWNVQALLIWNKQQWWTSLESQAVLFQDSIPRELPQWYHDWLRHRAWGIWIKNEI